MAAADREDVAVGEVHAAGHLEGQLVGEHAVPVPEPQAFRSQDRHGAEHT